MLNNIHNVRSERGFTIVELLIVIVVIAILAAITIVAYNGIQNRAHNSAQQTNAENLAKKLEAYASINGSYPVSNTAANMTTAMNVTTNGTEAVLTGTGITLGTPTASTADGVVQLRTCAAGAQTAGTTVPTGYVIYIWDRSLTTPGLNAVQAGGIGSIAFVTNGSANTVTCTNAYTAA